MHCEGRRRPMEGSFVHPRNDAGFEHAEHEAKNIDYLIENDMRILRQREYWSTKLVS